MRRPSPGVVVTDRDRKLFCQLFENRAMRRDQIHVFAFLGASEQATLKRLSSLVRNGFLDRQYVDSQRNRILAVFENTPKALKEIADAYPHKITSELCKSDSVEHDLCLVDLRAKFQRLSLVNNYLTENMLQGCEKFSSMEAIRPFVVNNTDAAFELKGKSKKIWIGLEFENSEKAHERYVRKLVNYYSNDKVQIIFYVCGSPRVRVAVADAERAMIGDRSPKCYYALLSDVLKTESNCTFVDIRGDKTVLT